MPRKITIDDLKNKRDYCKAKIKLNALDMQDTNDAYESTVAELESRETKRLDVLKDKLFQLAMPYFGINISEDDLEKWFKRIMDDERNRGAVNSLRREEEERLRQIEAHETERIAELKKKHKTLFDKVEGVACDEPADTDNSDSLNETTPEEIISEEPKT